MAVERFHRPARGPGATRASVRVKVQTTFTVRHAESRPGSTRLESRRSQGVNNELVAVVRIFHGRSREMEEMNGKNHLTYMVLGGAALFGVLVVTGAPLQSALLLALVLACPLMMVSMMGGHGGHGEPKEDDNPRRAGRFDDSDDRARTGGHQH